MGDQEPHTNPTTAEATPAEDLEMGETESGEPTQATQETQAPAGEDAGEEGSVLPDVEPETPKRETYIDYLKSPIVQLVVGKGDERTVLSAHEALLVKSPYFADACSTLSEPKRIDLPDEDLGATGSFLEYLYNGEYFPRRLGTGKDSALEHDPDLPVPDDDGVALLKHARVYTLADKFGLPALKSLAHSKIHRTRSTARGEIAYARYVYAQTTPEDTTIRRPVAAFWATRSHVLRHEAEDEFRRMCLEFPQFGFDVLNMVLDLREKGEKQQHHHASASPSVAIERAGPGERSARKRARVSQG